ncbi:hypothetical protein N7539_006549 [Penicillium diatomitis]|uniref:Uncharacterized protein n=1 Tax=Penicillium diatomitis TaxID=2819901 RepID=A0A9W9X3L5_9EURO|nr:uncharacterized protein N7539_006549 [Penicillium diatomitis]KAJ5483103.1 hypothetical protein N7539_006549 [Penicillium diatomitis]
MSSTNGLVEDPGSPLDDTREQLQNQAEMDSFEKDPQELVANGFRPVWTQGDGYPGPIPDDIAAFINPDEQWNKTLRLVGPMSSLFWLAGLDDFVTAIDSPEFTMRDEVVPIPSNASIRSMLPHLYDSGKIPGAVYKNYCLPPPDLSVIAFPVRPVQIPGPVTSTVQQHNLRDLFPLCRQQCFPGQIRSVKISEHSQIERVCRDIERDVLPSLGGGNFLFRGLSRRGLVSSMAFFLPVINSHHFDQDFGPGIYTTPSIQLALRYAAPQGALMVFRNTDFRSLKVWELNARDWSAVTRYWTGRTLSNPDQQCPDDWDGADVISGPTTSPGPRRHEFLVPGDDTQVVATSYPAMCALARSLALIIWLA